MTDLTEARELSPCPFCGGRAELTDNDDSMWYVRCMSGEKCWALIGLYHTKADAIAAWNRRPDHELARMLAEALKSIGDLCKLCRPATSLCSKNDLCKRKRNIEAALAAYKAAGGEV
jgi:Lar family restriction alleviation protein